MMQQFAILNANPNATKVWNFIPPTTQFLSKLQHRFCSPKHGVNNILTADKIQLAVAVAVVVKVVVYVVVEALVPELPCCTLE
jgi:hypothetical protein